MNPSELSTVTYRVRTVNLPVDPGRRALRHSLVVAPNDVQTGEVNVLEESVSRGQSGPVRPAYAFTPPGIDRHFQDHDLI